MPLDPEEFKNELEELDSEDEFGNMAIKLIVQYEVPRGIRSVGKWEGGGCYHNYCFGEEFPWMVWDITRIDKKSNSDKILVTYKIVLAPQDELAGTPHETLEHILNKFKPGSVVYTDDLLHIKIVSLEGEVIKYDFEVYDPYYGGG